MIERTFLLFLRLSISGAIVLAFLFLSSPIWESRTSPIVRRILWLVLALFLLLPVRYSLPVSVFDVSVLSNSSSNLSPLPTDEGEVPEIPDTEPTTPARLSQPAITPLFLCSLLWVAGVFVFALYQLFAALRLRRTLFAASHVPENTALTSAFQELALQSALRCTPRLSINPNVETPLAIGFFRPTIFLPREDYPAEELDFILRHELTHIKTGDIWLKLLLLAANSVHWLNPLVYCMRREAFADMEAACDSRVSSKNEFSQRRRYAETILSSIETQKPKGNTLTTQFYGGVKTMKKRIKNILDPVSPRSGVTLAVLVVFTTVLLTGLIACSTGPQLRRVTGGFYMGSLYDYAEIGKTSVGVQGLSPNMTKDDVMAYYGLTPDDFRIEDVEAKPTPNADSAKWSSYMLDQCVFFDETGEIPCTITFNFREDGTIRNVGFSVRYIGLPWKEAHTHAMSLFDEINGKVGKKITQEEWMQNPDQKGVVINDFADPLESLSEFDSHFMRQYVYIGSDQSNSFAVSMSYQDFSGADTTKGLGQNVDDLFTFSLTIPIR